MLIVTPPMVRLEAKTACAELKPLMPDMSSVATLPVSSLVMAIFRPGA